MAGHKVHALFRFAFLVSIDFMAAKQSVGKMLYRALIAAQEAAHVIAEAPVPLSPAIADKTAHLVETSGVPRLGDTLCARQRWIGLDIPKHGRIGHHVAARIARQNRGEIEAESIHMHLLHPVP